MKAAKLSIAALSPLIALCPSKNELRVGVWHYAGGARDAPPAGMLPGGCGGARGCHTARPQWLRHRVKALEPDPAACLETWESSKTFHGQRSLGAAQ